MIRKQGVVIKIVFYLISSAVLPYHYHYNNCFDKTINIFHHSFVNNRSKYLA